jgi:hypothetical protein
MNNYLVHKTKYIALKNYHSGGTELQRSAIKCTDPSYPYYDPLAMRCCENNKCQGPGTVYLQNIITLPEKIQCQGDTLIHTFIEPPTVTIGPMQRYSGKHHGADNTAIDDAASVYPGTPGGYDETPGGYDETPGGYEKTPGGYEKTPGGYDETPGSHEKTPGSHEKTPGSHEKTPGGYDETPGSHEKTPGGYEKTPGGYDETPGSHEPPARDTPRKPTMNVPGTVTLTGRSARGGPNIVLRYGNPRTLDRGANGIIIKYEHVPDISEPGSGTRTGRVSSLAIKIGNIKPDQKVIEILKKSKCKHLIVQSVDANSVSFLIMEFVSGNLNNLIPITKGQTHSSNLVLLAVVDQVVTAFKCLRDAGLFYVDVKTSNILYRCLHDNEIHVILGDLGSAANASEIAYATYPAADRWKHGDGGKIPGSRESDVVWGIGILMLELLGLGNNINLCTWQHFKIKKDEHASKAIHHAVSAATQALDQLLYPVDDVNIIDRDIGDIIRLALNALPDQRPSLEGLLLIVRNTYQKILKEFMAGQEEARS